MACHCVATPPARSYLSSLGEPLAALWRPRKLLPSDMFEALQQRRWGDLGPYLSAENAEAVLQPWMEASQADAPLHVALRHQPPLVVVEQLLAAWPGAVFRVTVQGNTALHLALMHGAEEAVSKLLLRVWPQAAKRSNAEGMYPLHAAAGWKSPGAAVLCQLLLELHTAAAVRGLKIESGHFRSSRVHIPS
jgi:hypothetical protein